MGKQEGSTAIVVGEVIESRMGVQVTIAETVSGLMGKVLSLPSNELQVRASARPAGDDQVSASPPREPHTSRAVEQ